MFFFFLKFGWYVLILSKNEKHAVSLIPLANIVQTWSDYSKKEFKLYLHTIHSEDNKS